MNALTIDEMIARLRVMKEKKPDAYQSLSQRFWEDMDETERKQSNKKSMEAYIKARMNFLMKEALQEYDNNCEYSEARVIFRRKPHWDKVDWRTILVARANGYERELSEYKTNTFSMSWSIIDKSPKGDDGEGLHWKVSVEWSNENQNPFEEIYDEDAETINDEKDEE